MATEPLNSGGLQALQSPIWLNSRHEEILDLIDHLRSQGISKYVDIPQLIVCGDQSSGKSSVLEAISGLDFPVNDNVCTRFAIELILRRNPTPARKVSIWPDTERPDEEQIRLKSFSPDNVTCKKFSDIVMSAGNLMEIDKARRTFSKDILRVELSGPQQPHLTLVDLPGLYHAPDEHQDMDGIKFVETLVRSYIENPRSIILAVISAKNELSLQEVTTFTRKVDPQGKRTLGIITKPDKLDKGSKLENSFYLLSQNKRLKFRLGWHVVKNRTFEEREFSISERNESEAKFLSQGIWMSLPRSNVGIKTLVPRLCNNLKDHIVSQMPGFIADTQMSLQDAKLSLQKLGDARQTLREQRRYLLRGSEKFTRLMQNSLDGMYLDPFFRNTVGHDGYPKRLRAVVQNRLVIFRDAMDKDGEHIKIVDVEDKDLKRRYQTRTDFVEEVRTRMRLSRGRELPGNFNPFIVGELFYEQAQPWETVVERFIDYLLKDVRNATILMLHAVLDHRSVEGLLRHVVDDRLSELEENLREKTTELLQPQQTGHPITYNRKYVENIQETRDQYLRDSITEKLKAFFGDRYPTDLQANASFVFRMQGLIDSVSAQTETDMERFACCEAIDHMLSYYQVAMTKFVDDFGVLAVEKCLLEPLADTFRSHTVEDMSDEVVKDIASEDEETAAERKRLENKRDLLEKSLARLQLLEKCDFPVHEDQEEEDENKQEENGNTDDGSSAQMNESKPLSPMLRVSSPEDVVEDLALPIDTDDDGGWGARVRKSTTKRKKHRQASPFE